MKHDMNELFKVQEGKKATPKRNYDIRITLNKSGGGRQCVRFGLINKASDIGCKYKFIEVSDIEYLKTRLYFRFHEARTSRNVHVLSSSATKSQSTGFYFTITPSEKAEKLYRMNWIGKTYSLQYDDENELYYIEDVKED